MELKVENLGKKYEGHWIFKQVNLSLSSGTKLLITGKNGSGKSTFAKTITGLILPSEGYIQYTLNGNTIPLEQSYQHIQLCGPYVDLVEDFTLNEFLSFHYKFKPSLIKLEEIIEIGYFKEHQNKYLRNFSSGMKQRLKLLITLLSNTSLVVLDEPTSNLDLKGIKWYEDLVKTYALEKTLLVCSNSPEIDAQFCTQTLNIEDFISAKKA